MITPKISVKYGEDKKNKYIQKGGYIMRNYVAVELEVMLLEAEDVITSSTPDFTDDTNGDNGVWFPGQGGTQWN